ncbi:MAG: hypothetical protein WBD75_08075 [Phycisphaerae bacterium]
MDSLGFDPMPSMLSALEKQIESTTVPGPLPLDGPLGMDPMGQILGQLEASIEGTATPPTKLEEPDMFAPTLPEPPPLAVGGPRSPDPSIPEEHRAVEWIEMKPPLAARPFFAHDGLSREPYRPHPGSNPGSLGRSSIPTRWCPEKDHEVEESTCYECALWDDHGAGIEQCYHDWKQEKQDQEKGGDET